MSVEKNWQFELEEYIKQGEKRIMESLQKKDYIRRVDGKRYGKWEILIWISIKKEELTMAEKNNANIGF